MKKLLWILLFTLTAAACGTQNEPPENLIDENTYINLMIEMQLLKTYQGISDVDSTTVDSLIQAIFKKYEVTQEQFKKSHRYYQRHLEKQSTRIDQAIDRLRKDRIYKADSLASDTT